MPHAKTGAAVVAFLVLLYTVRAGELSSSGPPSIGRLAALSAENTRRAESDWLGPSPKRYAEIFRSADSREIILNNGLISRVWRLAPNAACVAFDNLMTDQ